MNEAEAGYSLENARRFRWSSVTGELHPERLAHLEKHLVGSQILDAGCGGGAYVELLASRGLDVTGLDYHAGFFSDNSTGSRRGHYVQGDITAMPFPAKCFDTTYCYDVLEHVNDAAALTELIRVSRRRLILAVPAHDAGVIGFGFTFAHYQDLTHLRTYTESSLSDLLERAGQNAFRIFPELSVDFVGLASSHLVTTTEVPWRRVLRDFYHVGLRRLLARARYPTIYTGWVAVVDLD